MVYCLPQRMGCRSVSQEVRSLVGGLVSLSQGEAMGARTEAMAVCCGWEGTVASDPRTDG